MIPSKRSSRSRSSILKSPKTLEPLQNLNFNSLSNENSPVTTTKFKRRVSFAEKKHVKEFCNSVEQGTVWDATYEEHDLSIVKIPCTSNQEHEVKITCNEDILSYNQENNMQLVCNKMSEKDLNAEGCDLKHTNEIHAIKYKDTELLSQNKIDIDNAYSTSDSVEVKTKEFNNISMELTTAVPYIVKPIDNIDNECSTSDSVEAKTKKCDNISMEITLTVPTILSSLQQPITNNKIKNCDSNFVPCNISNKTTIFHNASMEITDVVRTRCDKDIKCQDGESDRLTAIRKAHCYNDETTKLLNTSMNMTKAVSINIHSSNSIAKEQEKNAMNCEIADVVKNSLEELKSDVNHCETSINSDKTKICNDEVMEFTKAITVSPQNNLRNSALIQNTSCIQRNSNNSIPIDSNNDSINLVPDKTTIFYNNSMTITKIVSPSNIKGNCKEVIKDYVANIDNQNLSKTVLYPNMSMDITDVAMASQCNFQVENPVIDFAEGKQSMQLENCENSGHKNSLNNTRVHNDVLENITATVISSSLNSDIILNQQKHVVDDFSQHLNSSVYKTSVSTGVVNSVNIVPNIVLHESIQDADNIKAICTPINSLSNDTSSAVTLEISQHECFPHKYSQSITSNSRRTYTIQSLGTDYPCNKENNKILETNDIFCYISNNTVNCTRNNVTDKHNLDESQNKEGCDQEYLIEENNTNRKLEELQSITPPSFVCLDDLSAADKFVDIHVEMNCNSENIKNLESTEQENTLKLERNYHEYNLLQNNQLNTLKENKCKSQTFAIKQPFLNNETDNSKHEYEHQVRINKVQKLQLLDMESINAEPSFLECSSSTEIDTERLPKISSVEKNSQGVNIQGLCADKYNLENQTIECSLSNVSNIHEETSKIDIEKRDKLIHIQAKKTNGEDCLSTELSSSVEACHSFVEQDISVQLDPFSLLMNKLKACAKSDEIIWEVYHENIERRIFIIGFMSCSLLVVIFLNEHCDTISDQFVKEIKIISRLAGESGKELMQKYDADALIGIVHRVIIEKLDAKKFTDSCKNDEDVFSMLDHISKEVKLAMDFMFEVERLSDINLMEITHDSVSFISRTKRREIILKITIDIKPFDKIEPYNISVHCILGSVRKEDVKELIRNIKRDHKFLRRYINDVREYVRLMEESGSMTKRYY